MADPRQPTELIAGIADKMDELITADSPYHNYGSALRALNQAQRLLVHKIARTDRGRFLATTGVSFVADQSDYDLPDNFLYLKDVEIAAGSAQNTSRLWGDRRVPELKAYDRNWADNYTNNAAALRSFYLFGNKIRVVPTPMQAKNPAWTVLYYRNPADMHIGKPTAVGDDSLNLAATPTHGATNTSDGAYAGAYVIISSGTGAGQIREIESYTGDTRLASIAVAWSTNPDTDSVYEILSELDPVETEFLVYEALHRLMSKDADGARDFNAIHGLAYSDLRKEFQSHITRRSFNPSYTRLTVE